MSRISFRLTDVLVGLAVMATLTCLLLPAVQQARDDARLVECSNRARQIMLAILNKEAATQRFPLAMFGGDVADKINTDGPKPMSKGDGFSWTVSILPYMEEAAVYDNLSKASEYFREPITSDVFKKDGALIHDIKVGGLFCPSADSHSLETKDKEYKMLDVAAVSNYTAFVAGAAEGERKKFEISGLMPTNGGMIVTKLTSPKGLKIGDCKDGTSRTFCFAETKAKRHNYWMSGRGTITVGMPPDVVSARDILRNKRNDGFPEPTKDMPIGVNYGRNTKDKDGAKWFASKYPPSEYDWGASSNHAGGKVIHAFIDGRIVAVTENASSSAYFRAVTRAGAEPHEMHNIAERIDRPTSNRARRDRPLAPVQAIMPQGEQDEKIKKLEMDVEQLKAAVINLHKRVKELEGRK